MSEAVSLNNSTQPEVLQLNIDIIRPNPYQPRHTFDNIAITELAASIKEYGVITPICVRPAHGGTYELVAGERRLRAAKMAGLTHIPAILSDYGESDSAVVSLLENLQRKDLTFMEEAQAYYHLIKNHNLNQEELSRKVGKSQSAISNKLRLLRLSPIIKKIIADNELTERHARAIIRLPGEQTQLKVLNKVTKHGYNVRRTEELVEQELEKVGQAKEKPKKNGVKAGISDIKIFVNTLKQTVNLIKQAGVRASLSHCESKDFTEYTIRIRH